MIDSFETILKECGDMLCGLSPEARREGQWQGSQFKAEADLLAHEFLVDRLGAAISLPVVSEEDESSQEQQYNDYVIIDPIDGTASFANGFNGWLTQAALVRKQEVIACGIYAPELGEYYSAVKGEGCKLNDKPLPMIATADLSSIIDNYPEPRGMTKDIYSLLAMSSYVECGSIALKICKVAAGAADLFVKNMWPRDWDLAAPMLVARETGIELRNWDGNCFQLGKPGLRHPGIIAVNSESNLARVREVINSNNLAMMALT